MKNAMRFHRTSARVQQGAWATPSVLMPSVSVQLRPFSPFPIHPRFHRCARLAPFAPPSLPPLSVPACQMEGAAAPPLLLNWAGEAKPLVDFT